jgi:hypothetical protein
VIASTIGTVIGDEISSLKRGSPKTRVSAAPDAEISLISQESTLADADAVLQELKSVPSLSNAILVENASPELLDAARVEATAARDAWLAVRAGKMTRAEYDRRFAGGVIEQGYALSGGNSPGPDQTVVRTEDGVRRYVFDPEGNVGYYADLGDHKARFVILTEANQMADQATSELMNAAAIGPKMGLSMAGAVPNLLITGYDYSQGSVSIGEALFDVLPFGRALSTVKPLTRVEKAAEGVPLAHPPGSFSISDWSRYPGGVPRPEGPFRLVEGAEYEAARAAANKANATIRREQGLVGQPVDVHEIQPVKFGGSPTDPTNKVILPREIHRQQVTPWWNQLQKDLER